MQITRKYWDWLYHCSTSTSAPLSAPCPTGDPDYIGELQNAYQGVTRNTALDDPTNWTLVEGAGCKVKTLTKYVDGKNVYVNCPDFQVDNTVVFGGDLVVFAGDVSVEGSDPTTCIRFNYAGTDDPCDESTPTRSHQMTVYLQNGNLTRQNEAFVAKETFIYQDVSAESNREINFGAGTSGRVYISAPTEPSEPFFNLAIWSENCAGRKDASPGATPCPGHAADIINGLGASTALTLEGIFFFPNGRVDLGGQPTADGVARSQFVAWDLSASGGAEFNLVPNPEFTLEIPVGGVQLIR
jgi:hypothetical protein